jgi:thiol-disulfide isomerase/thioredoxin
MVALRAKSVAVLALLSLGCATVHASSAGPAPEVLLLDGTLAPWPSLLSSQGNTLVVFATLWCQICRRERPAVEAWARSHPEQRTVYVFSGGELPKAAEDIRALHLDAALTVVVDADGRLADHYAVQSTPTLLLLGAGGQLLSTQHRFDAPALGRDPQ